MKSHVKPTVAVILLLSSVVTVSARPAYHWCGIAIRRATPDELTLELWSTSQATSYSVDINYARASCCPWNGHEQNWVVRERFPPGLYALPWSNFYDEDPEPGMEACINWTCQPEAVVIYWSQDYRAVLGYLFLPLVKR